MNRSDPIRGAWKTLTEPVFEHWGEQPYVAIRTQATMAELPVVIPQSLDEVFCWLGKQDVTPAGPPFVRYYVIDMVGSLDIAMGVPVAVDMRSTLAGDERVSAGVLPAGAYAVAEHTGPYDRLEGATAQLLDWAEKKGINWQMLPDGETWAARLEFYSTDPNIEPDPQKWKTELAFLVETVSQ